MAIFIVRAVNWISYFSSEYFYIRQDLTSLVKAPNEWSRVLEYLVVFICVVILVWIPAGLFYDHRLIHGYPVACKEFCFFHIPFAEYIMQHGFLDQAPPQVAAGIKHTYPIQPAIPSYLVAYSGLFVHEISVDELHNLFLFAILIFIPLMAYVIIRHHDKKLAILSLPLLMFSVRDEFITNMYTGKINVFLGFAFLLLVCFIFLHFLEYHTSRWFYVHITIVLSLIVLTHIPQALYLIPVLIVLTISTHRCTHLKTQDAYRFLIVGILVLIICVDFLMVFLKAWVPHYPSAFSFGPQTFFQQTVYMNNNIMLTFAQYQLPVWVWIIIVAGAILALFQAIKQPDSRVFLLFFILVLMSFIGIVNSRFLDLHRIWYVYFACFFGYFFLFILSHAQKKLRIISDWWIYPLTIILVLIVIIGNRGVLHSDQNLSRDWSFLSEARKYLSESDKILIIVPREHDMNKYWHLPLPVHIWDSAIMKQDLMEKQTVAMDRLLFEGFRAQEDCQDMVLERTSFLNIHDMITTRDICNVRKHNLCEYSVLIYMGDTTGEYSDMVDVEYIEQFANSVDYILQDLQTKGKLHFMYVDGNNLVGRLNLTNGECNSMEEN